MTEQLTDRFGRPAEIVQARTLEPRTVQCPWCLSRATSADRYFVGVFDDDRHAFPFCRRCLDRHAPNLATAVRAMNAIAETAGLLGWNDLRKVNNGLHYVLREAFAEVPEELRRREAKAGQAAVTRAVRAMIARQAHGITDISVIETVDTADVYGVIEALATIIGGPVKELADGDVSGWLQELFESADEDGDEPA